MQPTMSKKFLLACGVFSIAGLLDGAFSFHLVPQNPARFDRISFRIKEAALSSSSSSEQGGGILVAMTRELGKNDKLRKSLLEHPSLTPVELPCIAHADGPDYKNLKATLQDKHWDYVAITSPEAARVLASVWNDCTFTNTPAVAAVGKATETALEEAGIPVVFCPSKATAEVLVKELPLPENFKSSSQPPRVLYPASAKAQKTLENGLKERGFDVVRLNTYDTVTAEWTDEQRAVAGKIKIACFASPSAVKGWLANNNSQRSDCRSVLAACIGETSAKACRELGWSEDFIFYPDQPGIEGWVQAVVEASTTLLSATEQR